MGVEVRGTLSCFPTARRTSKYVTVAEAVSVGHLVPRPGDREENAARSLLSLASAPQPMDVDDKEPQDTRGDNSEPRDARAEVRKPSRRIREITTELERIAKEAKSAGRKELVALMRQSLGYGEEFISLMAVSRGEGRKK